MVPHYLTDKPSKLHKWLATELQRISKERGQKRTIEGPRESAKSTWITFVYILWSICEGTESYICVFADTASQARQRLDDIKHELETNETLAEYYPQATGRGSTWNVDSIVTPNGVTVEALGTGKKIRGRRRRQFRPTLIIIDDPEGEAHAESAVMRQKVWSWYIKAVEKAGQTGVTNIIIAGTTLHRNCLVARCAKLPTFRSKRFQAIESYPDDMGIWEQWKALYLDPLDEESEDTALGFFKRHRKKMLQGSRVLWPEREPLYELMKMRAADQVAFESEKQNNPVDPAACEWPESYFDYEGFWFDAWPKDMTVKTLALDPSKGREARPGDYQAFIRFGRGADGYLYVEADMLRIPVEDACEHLIEVYDDFPADGVAIETNTFQELMATEIRKRSAARGFALPIHEVENTVKKTVRIRRLGPRLCQRLFRFKRRSQGTALLVEQLRDFPNGEHDDGPDALEMALRLAIALFNERYESGSEFGRRMKG